MNREVVMGLFILRNQLSNYPSFFEKEKDFCAQLYLLPSETQIVEAVKFDVNNEFSLALKINQLEFDFIQRNTGSNTEPFNQILVNNLSYQYLSCLHHKPMPFNSARDFPNNPYMRHSCELDYIPSMVVQEFEKTFCELWQIKITQNSKRIIASGSREFFSWIYDEESKQYKNDWRKNAFEQDDILDWDFYEQQNLIICSVNFKTLVFLDLENGQEKSVLKDAHKDIIKSVYVFREKNCFMTGSIDGYIIIRNLNNVEKKEHEIQTRRVAAMKVTHDEKEAFCIDGDLKSITQVCLVNYNTKQFIIEKDIINSMAISGNDEFLLLNTGTEIPELHIWEIKTRQIVGCYQGHKQHNFSIECGFYTPEIIYCGSEDGRLLFWHVNQFQPVKQIQLGNSCINSVAIFRDPETRKIRFATASDNSKVTIIE